VRIGIVSDIHCNVAALELALARMGDVDELLCAGDSVYEYRFSTDVIELLREREAHYVFGNHESVLLGPHGVRARGADHVRQESLEYMAARPGTIELVFGGKRLLMTHASPLEPRTQYVTARSPELRRLAEVDADVVVLGHTHAPMAERVGRVLVVNPGSVGEGRDPANGRRSSYALWDPSTDEVFLDHFVVGDPAVAEPVLVSAP
jgi:putative phosphoesterase